MVSVHLSKCAESDVLAFSPHVAYCISGPIDPRKIRAERCEDACLPPRCLCVCLRRLEMHDADRDIPALTNGLQQLNSSDRQPFLQRYCVQHGGKSEPVKLYLLRFESLTS
jgi:hypothetical protein